MPASGAAERRASSAGTAARQCRCALTDLRLDSDATSLPLKQIAGPASSLERLYAKFHFSLLRPPGWGKARGGGYPREHAHVNAGESQEHFWHCRPRSKRCCWGARQATALPPAAAGTAARQCRCALTDLRLDSDATSLPLKQIAGPASSLERLSAKLHFSLSRPPLLRHRQLYRRKCSGGSQKAYSCHYRMGITGEILALQARQSKLQGGSVAPISPPIINGLHGSAPAPVRTHWS